MHAQLEMARRVTLVLMTLSVWAVLMSSRAQAGINQWTSLGPAGTYIDSVAVDPSTPTTIYAGASDGVYKSTDGGAHWDAINTGLSSSTIRERSLAVDPVTPTTLYVGTNEGDGVSVMQQVPAAECGDGILSDGEACDLGGGQWHPRRLLHGDLYLCRSRHRLPSLGRCVRCRRELHRRRRGVPERYQEHRCLPPGSGRV